MNILELQAIELELRNSLFDDDATDEQRAEIVNKWVESDMDFKAKAESYAHVIKRFDAEIELNSNEAARFNERANRIKRQRASLSQFFSIAVLRNGGRIETPLVTVSAKENSRIAITGSPSAFPDQYVKEDVSKRVIAGLVREGLESGDERLKGLAKFENTVTIR